MNILANKICEDRKIREIFCNCSSENKFLKKDSVVKSVKNLKSAEELSFFLNINCMMNVKIKQTQPIWETNFGKRLIYGKQDFKQSQESLGSGKFSQKAVQKRTNDLIESRSNVFKEKKDFFHSKTNSVLSKNGREATARSKGSSRNLTASKKCKIRNAKNKMPEWRKKNVSENQLNVCDSRSKKPSAVPSAFTQTQSIILTEDKENMESADESSEIFPLANNQGLLTNRVKHILDNISNENICEHCEKSFPQVHELIHHRKTHETEKENCLLCDKIFNSAEDFIKHLLTHEGVDRYSCKMCKKYFPTLKTFKSHYEEFHLVALKSPSQNDAKIRQWMPTYECPRCKAEFSSKEAYKNHKRIHQKMDLTGAYLMCD